MGFHDLSSEENIYSHLRFIVPCFSNHYGTISYPESRNQQSIQGPNRRLFSNRSKMVNSLLFSMEPEEVDDDLIPVLVAWVLFKNDRSIIYYFKQQKDAGKEL